MCDRIIPKPGQKACCDVKDLQSYQFVENSWNSKSYGPTFIWVGGGGGGDKLQKTCTIIFEK